MKKRQELNKRKTTNSINDSSVNKYIEKSESHKKKYICILQQHSYQEKKKINTMTKIIKIEK